MTEAQRSMMAACIVLVVLPEYKPDPDIKRAAQDALRRIVPSIEIENDRFFTIVTQADWYIRALDNQDARGAMAAKDRLRRAILAYFMERMLVA